MQKMWTAWGRAEDVEGFWWPSTMTKAVFVDGLVAEDNVRGREREWLGDQVHVGSASNPRLEFPLLWIQIPAS